MTDKVTLWKRRKEFFRRVMAGTPPAQVAKKMAQNPKNDYDISIQGLKDDWTNRDEWLPVLFMFEDEEAFKQNILGDTISEKERLTRLAETSSNENIILGASKAKARINEKLLDIAHEAGILTKQADKHEVEVSGDVSLTSLIEDAMEEKKRDMETEGEG